MLAGGVALAPPVNLAADAKAVPAPAPKKDAAKARPTPRGSCFSGLWKTVRPRCSAPFLLGLVLMAWMMQQEGPVAQLSRIAGAGAKVSEEASAVLVDLLRGAGAVTSASVHLAEDAIWSSRRIGEDVWSGIQLRNVTISRETGTFIAPSSKALMAWLATSDAEVIISDEHEVIKLCRAAIAAVSTGTSFIRRDMTNFAMDSGYSYVEVTATYTAGSGYVLVWQYLSANFSVEWANPFWAFLEMNALQNLTEVNRLLYGHIVTLPTPLPEAPKTVYIKAETFLELFTWKFQSLLTKLSAPMAIFWGRSYGVLGGARDSRANYKPRAPEATQRSAGRPTEEL